MMWLLAVSALAGWHVDPAPDQTSVSQGRAPEGVRTLPVGSASGVSVGYDAVLGRDGGTSALRLTTHVNLDRLQIHAHLPVTFHRAYAGRRAGLGALRLALGTRFNLGNTWHEAGVEGVIPTAGDAWTWVTAGPDAWPGGGVSAYWTARFDLGSSTSLLATAKVGVMDYEDQPPFPLGVTFTGGGSIAIHQAFLDRFGIMGEVAGQGWDPSPFEVSALLWVDALKGLRVRAGAVLPIGVWAGWSTVADPGVREVVLRAETHFSF